LRVGLAGYISREYRAFSTVAVDGNEVDGNAAPGAPLFSFFWTPFTWVGFSDEHDNRTRITIKKNFPFILISILTGPPQY
jgi:hypothetical protein